MKIGRAVVITGVLLMVSAVIYFAARILTNGWGGDLIMINPPPGYTVLAQNHGPYDASWQLRKNETAYTVKSELKMWAQSPLPRLTQVIDRDMLLGGYEARTAKSVQKNPQRIVVNRNKQATLNNIVFTGYQTQEARSDAFVVIHYAAFEVRGHRYNGHAVFHFADKRASPANLKIAQTEWQKILASIQ